MLSKTTEVVEQIYHQFLEDTSSRIIDKNLHSSSESCSNDAVAVSDISHSLPPFLVALGGVAGASKTTVSKHMLLSLKHIASSASSSSSSSAQVKKSNFTISLNPNKIFVLPIDGYHLYRHELDKIEGMPHQEAIRRRGHPSTFNSKKYFTDLKILKETGKENFPAFDHATKDPEEEHYKVDATSTISAITTTKNEERNENSSSSSSSSVIIERAIVIVEGLYSLYDGDEFWKSALHLFDMKIYLKVPSIDIATERLTKRHMQVWNVSHEEAHERASGSDRDNGILVIEHIEKLQQSANEKLVVLETVDDEEFAKS